MRADWNASPRLKHRGARLVLAIAGVCAILASTGGGFPGFSDACVVCTAPAAVSLFPARAVVQAGMPVTFSATTNVSNPAFQWCRVPPGQSACVSLPDGSGSSYTLAGTGLGDDGASFRVTVRGNEGLATSGFGWLHVSPMPAVVFEDREFAEAEWIVESSIPPENAPSFTVARMETGGNPDAFRKVTYNVSSGPSTLRVFHGRLPAFYDPTSQGAIYLVVFSADCRILSADSAGLSARLMLEQGGRRYTGLDVMPWCERNVWRGAAEVFFERALFRLEDGPACGATEACPDFSMGAAPIRFGFMSAAGRSSGAAAATLEHGFDNWKVAVWRR